MAPAAEPVICEAPRDAAGEMRGLPAHFLCLLGLSAGLTGCLEQHSFLRSGNATSAEIMYSGDVTRALPIAKQHCAAYGRVPRLVDTSPDVAYFACDPS